MLTCESLSLKLPWSIGGNISIRLELVLQELPETTVKLSGFSRRAFGFCIRTRGGRSFICSQICFKQTVKCRNGAWYRKGRNELWYERKWIWPQTRSIRYLVSGTILIGAAGAPMGNLAHRWMTSEVYS